MHDLNKLVEILLILNILVINVSRCLNFFKKHFSNGLLFNSQGLL